MLSFRDVQEIFCAVNDGGSANDDAVNIKTEELIKNHKSTVNQ